MLKTIPVIFLPNLVQLQKMYMSQTNPVSLNTGIYFKNWNADVT
jgi:hypothetical protein